MQIVVMEDREGVTVQADGRKPHFYKRHLSGAQYFPLAENAYIFLALGKLGELPTEPLTSREWADLLKQQQPEIALLQNNLNMVFRSLEKDGYVTIQTVERPDSRRKLLAYQFSSAVSFELAEPSKGNPS